MCCLFMVTLSMPNTMWAKASNDSIIQLNGMKAEADGQGWAVYTTQADSTIDAGRIKMTTPSTAIGTILNSGGQNKTEYSNLNEDADYVFTVEVNQGYTAHVMVDGQNTSLMPVEGQEGTYTFTVHIAYGASVVLVDPSFSLNVPEPNPPAPQPGPEEVPYMDILVGSQLYSHVTNGAVFKGNFNLDALDIQIVKIYAGEEDVTGVSLSNCKTIGYIPDQEGRNPLELHVSNRTTDSITVNIENHEGNIDPPFYFTNITFAQKGASYVGVSSNLHPFLFQDTVATDKVSLSPDVVNPSSFTVYYGCDQVALENVSGESPISGIAIVDDIAAGAVTIEGNQVKFHSAFYNTVVLQVTLEDGTKGYVQINRIGIELAGYDFGDNKEQRPDGSGPLNCAYHGSQNGLDLSDSRFNNKYNIIASFYFDGSTGATGADYDLICTAVYQDGNISTDIVIAASTTQGGVNGEHIMVSDYVLWSGVKAEAPVRVSVTAVNHNALTNAESFGGARFGSGMGVTKEFR